MPVFYYRAIDASGVTVSGEVDMPDERAAARHLQQDGYVPIEIDRTRTTSLRALLDTEITPRQALSARDRVAFTRSLATLLGAGLPLDRALATLRDLGTSKSLRRVAGSLLDRVRDGASLSRAVDGEGTAFPPLYRGIVRAGEAGARLDAALTDLADMLEQAQRRLGELRSALIYPAFLVVTAIGSVGVLLAYVVPTFEPLLADAGVEPPPITQAVIGTARFVETYWVTMLSLVGTLILAGAIALRNPTLRKKWDRAKLSVPGLGETLRKFETARLCRLLGTMLGNGVALPAALNLARDGLGNRAFAAEVSRVLPEVEAGRGLAQPLRDGALLPPLALQLIQVGQDSGDLTPMLMKTAEIFDAEAKRAFDQMLSLLTPVLTLLMGGLIALIISSILFALFSINELAI